MVTTSVKPKTLPLKSEKTGYGRENDQPVIENRRPISPRETYTIHRLQLLLLYHRRPISPSEDYTLHQLQLRHLRKKSPRIRGSGSRQDSTTPYTIYNNYQRYLQQLQQHHLLQRRWRLKYKLKIWNLPSFQCTLYSMLELLLGIVSLYRCSIPIYM